MFSKVSSSASGDPAVVTKCLSAAGWQPDRTVDTSSVESAIRDAGFPFHDAARRFLREFHGLAIDVPINGFDDQQGFVHFAPEMVLRFLGPAEVPYVQRLLSGTACPIGTAGGHTVFVFMDADERSWLLDMEWLLFAPLAISPSEMVQVLCDGRNGRADAHLVDADRNPTGRVLRADNEREYWDLGQFPHVAPWLPPTSLSPGRRPPTWRAMVRAAEQTLAKGAASESVLITCGGFTTSPSGKAWFVADCENCIYVRSRAGFRVAAPHPGISPGFRAGQVLPFEPPAAW